MCLDYGTVGNGKPAIKNREEFGVLWKQKLATGEYGYRFYPAK